MGVSDLFEAARAADPACVGCAVLRSDRAPEPGWVVADRPDGVRVRVDGVAADSPAVAAVLALDLSPAAVAARALARARLKALTEFVTRDDDTAIAVRLLIDAVATLANDEFEALGRGRPLVLDRLMGYVAANPTAGDPLAPKG